MESGIYNEILASGNIKLDSDERRRQRKEMFDEGAGLGAKDKQGNRISNVHENSTMFKTPKGVLDPERFNEKFHMK